MIKYKCVKCGQLLESPSSMARLQDTCPVCGNACIVPTPKNRSWLILAVCGGLGLAVLVGVAVLLYVRSGARGQPPLPAEHEQLAQVAAARPSASVTNPTATEEDGPASGGPVRAESAASRPANESAAVLAAAPDGFVRRKKLPKTVLTGSLILNKAEWAIVPSGGGLSHIVLSFDLGLETTATNEGWSLDNGGARPKAKVLLRWEEADAKSRELLENHRESMNQELKAASSLDELTVPGPFIVEGSFIAEDDYTDAMREKANYTPSIAPLLSRSQVEGLPCRGWFMVYSVTEQMVQAKP